MSSASWTKEASAEFEAESQAGFDFVGMIIRRLWMIIVGGIIGLGLGYLYFTKQVPIYESSSRILVVREVSSDAMPIRGIGDRQVERNDDTAALLIRSPLVVSEAVEKYELDRLPPFVGNGDPTHKIVSGLKARSIAANGNVLELTYRCDDPQSCVAVLEAIIGSYKSFLGKTHESVNEETVALISEAKDNLLKQLSEMESAYRKFRQHAPLLWNGSGEAAQNIHKARLIEIESLRSELRISRTQTKAQLLAIEGAIARGENREALSLMASRVLGGDQDKKDAKGLTAEEQLFPLMLEEQMLLDNHGADHPKVLSIQRKIQLTRQFLAQNLTDNSPQSPEQTANDLANQRQDFLTVYVNSLSQEIGTTQEKERELNLLFEQEHEASKALEVFEIKDATYQADMKRIQQLFDGVVKRLDEINLIKNYGGYKMEVISPASAGWQVEPNQSKILTLAGVLGLLGGLGLAFVVDLSDRSFRSPEDISKQLGMPILGHIPQMADSKPKDSSARLSPKMVTFFQPKSRMTEAYRAVRTALYYNSRGEMHKVFQVTSPHPGDGKTTLTSNLAICIAQSGKSVLLIDADLRRPKVHTTFGIGNEVGLSSVIRGEAEPQDAIQPTEVENLWILTSGTPPDNPAELLTSRRFDALLDVLREKYDIVLIDTPPTLAVTDPGTVASRVDGVILTMRITKRTRGDATHSAALLRSLGANLLGVVVNGTGPEKSFGTGYGDYGAHRYYNSRHESDDQDGSYFAEAKGRRVNVDAKA